MRQKTVKRVLSLIMTSAMVMSSSSAVWADPIAVGTGEEENEAEVLADFSSYEPGVTVEADADSPTGYTATFIYDELDSYEGLGEIVKVQMYSDCMMLFETGSGTQGTISPDDMHAPEEYQAGMNPAGGSGNVAYYVDMEEFAEGLWAVQVPLSSGAFVYNFQVTDADGNTKSRLDDPSNPTMVNSATGIKSLSSMVYVPYDADKQGSSTYADRTVENPAAEGSRGTVETVSYAGADDTQHGLAVYLPNGYDADREEPYNVLYLSHGTSGDIYGDELRWMNEGAVANIMDNLGADFVVVTMNNQQFGQGEGHSGPNWLFSDVETDQIDYIMPYVESNYNVSTEASGRAYAGLSMGGSTTSNFLMTHPDLFGYFGIWSYANTDGSMTGQAGIDDADIQSMLSALENKPEVMIAAGTWDFGYTPCMSYGATLETLGFEPMYLEVPAAHDWENWQLTYAYAAKNFFFQKEEEPSKFEGYEAGVTVEADEESPTGYTATFIFDEACLANIDYDYYDSQYPNNTLKDLDLTNIVGVQIYSNTALLFTYDEQTAGTPLDPANNAHDPSEYAVGLYPAGGDTTGNLYGGKKINYYAEMEEFADGKWGVSFPLTSGATDYNIRITDADGSTDGCYFYDPANPPMLNTASNIYSRSSMVYVPFDSSKQGVDRSVENPRTDGGEGTQTFAAYTAADGSERYIGIHLPNGFDANRAEPYKVLYMSHGAQSEPLGSEMRWLNECAVSNIADNMDLDYIIVTMNSIDLKWNIPTIWGEMELIFDYMEENYNASAEASDRAFAGFSMGGYLTSHIYIDHVDEFGYYGIWSYADVNYLNNASDEVKAALVASDAKISVGAGTWDYLLGPCQSFEAALDEMGIAYSDLVVEGSHDWRTWQLMAADAFENFFFVEEKFEGYEPGVTVEEDEDSPTGYTATFIYKELESYDGLDSAVAKVELYSDCMMLFETESGTRGTISADDAITPEEYVAGLNPAGGNGATTFYKEMIDLGDGLWGCKVPLSSGAFVYNFRVTDENGNQKARLDDPSNPTLWNTATNIHSLSSMVYVPYNEEKMGTSLYADRTIENPRTDEQTGTVETIAYTGAAEDTRGLAVYLPYGYEADREEPYNVLYLSHGASGDAYGNELRWMNEGAVPNIMDNLIADGKIEPFVVVTMNNQDFGWDYDKIWAEQELIFAEIEGKYNVSSEASGRAFAGLSMGGYTTSRMYLNHAEDFTYFGVWSYADANVADHVDYLNSLTDKKYVMTGAGYWDFLLSIVEQFGTNLEENGFEVFDSLIVPAAHDWETWQLLYAYAAENFFFRATDEFDGYEPGVTVEEDENSPTGYTATFIYKELESYEGLEGNITKVELYSDCMLLFETGSGTKGTISGADAIQPEDYVAGLNPAGGSGATTYYKEMTKIGDGLWGCEVPLSSGAFVYNFRLTDQKGNQKSRTDDPSNPTLWNTATNIHSLSSMVYVPYNEEKMGTGEFADRTVENARTDDQTGTVETIAYTGAEGDTRGLAVYLPYGYDAEREEPYNVLYLSHGASGDRVGNELRWMNEGAVANIMDNLTADGKIDPFVVVTMNNQDLGWNYDKIWAEQELIFAEIEGKYNVSAEAEGRAFAGLSMGGITTSNMYLNHGDEFSYFGVWSAANSTVEGHEDFIKGLTDKHIMLAGGYWDFGLASCVKLGENLAALGIDYDLYYEVPAAHDWETWQMIYAYAAENFFFQDEEFQFADVTDENAWYYDAVYWAAETGITNGRGTNADGEPIFQPLRDLTRGEVVTFLYRMAETPDVSGITDVSFTDVTDEEAFYYNAVLWAAKNEITTGYGEGTFKPDNKCTRAMIVTFLMRYAKLIEKYTEPTEAIEFSDVNADDWFYDGVMWAASTGVTTGYGAGTFQPNYICNRAMMVTFLMRLANIGA